MGLMAPFGQDPFEEDQEGGQTDNQTDKDKLVVEGKESRDKTKKKSKKKKKDKKKSSKLSCVVNFVMFCECKLSCAVNFFCSIGVCYWELMSVNFFCFDVSDTLTNCLTSLVCTFRIPWRS